MDFTEAEAAIASMSEDDCFALVHAAKVRFGWVYVGIYNRSDFAENYAEAMADRLGLYDDNGGRPEDDPRLVMDDDVWAEVAYRADKAVGYSSAGESIEMVVDDIISTVIGAKYAEVTQ